MRHRPLLMDSEDEEEEEKHSSDSDYEQAKTKYSDEPRLQGPSRRAGGPGPSAALMMSAGCPRAWEKRGLPDPSLMSLAPVPFFAAQAQAAPTGGAGRTSLRRAGFPPRDSRPEEFDVFTRRPSAQEVDGARCARRAGWPPSVDVFGSTRPFQPFPPSASKRQRGPLELVPFEDNWGVRSRGQAAPSETVLTAERTKQDTAKSNGEAAHGTRLSAKKPAKPSHPEAGPQA